VIALPLIKIAMLQTNYVSARDFMPGFDNIVPIFMRLGFIA
jgi:hypothetical protein